MPATPAFNIVSDDIFKILGLENLDETEKRNLLTTMLETVQNRVIARVFDQLNDQEQNQIAELFKANDDDGIALFLKKRGIPSVPDLVAQESMLYKMEMVQSAAQLKATA